MRPFIPFNPLGGFDSVAGCGTVDIVGTLAALGTLGTPAPALPRFWSGLGVWKPGNGVEAAGPGCCATPDSERSRWEELLR